MSVQSRKANDAALLERAIQACVRAKDYAQTEDNVGLAIAAALLRCDLYERFYQPSLAGPVPAGRLGGVMP